MCLDLSRLVVIIPAFNEEESIELVLREIPREGSPVIIVVDNGSTDATAERARAAGATVVTEMHRGYGKACLKGIQYARTLDPSAVVFLDADHSDFPDETTQLVQKLAEGYDLVIGSRVLGNAERGALLPQARWGNWLAVTLIRIFFGQRYSDLGPFRAIRWQALLAMKMVDQNFGWTVEMQVKAAIMGLKVAEVPVSYRKRIGTSKVTGTLSGTIRAGHKILWTIFKHGFSAPNRNRRAPQPEAKIST